MNIYNKQKEALKRIVENFQNIQKQADEYVNQSNFNIEMITSFRAYSNKLSQDIKAQKEMIENTFKELTHQQLIAKNAYIEVKTLEKLKEKQKEKYDREFLLEETKTLDDIVSTRRKVFC